jgi:hypothetical protein
MADIFHCFKLKQVGRVYSSREGHRMERDKRCKGKEERGKGMKV